MYPPQSCLKITLEEFLIAIGEIFKIVANKKGVTVQYRCYPDRKQRKANQIGIITDKKQSWSICKCRLAFPSDQ